MCAHLSGIKQEDMLKISWISTPCLHQASLATKIVEKMDELKQELSKETSVVWDKDESSAGTLELPVDAF